MAAIEVRILASDWAANLLAPMLLTLLQRIADSLALQIVNFVYLLLCH